MIWTYDMKYVYIVIPFQCTNYGNNNQQTKNNLFFICSSYDMITIKCSYVRRFPTPIPFVLKSGPTRRRFICVYLCIMYVVDTVANKYKFNIGKLLIIMIFELLVL